jgi:hypothetical protein
MSKLNNNVLLEEQGHQRLDPDLRLLSLCIAETANRMFCRLNIVRSQPVVCLFKPTFPIYACIRLDLHGAVRHALVYSMTGFFWKKLKVSKTRQVETDQQHGQSVGQLCLNGHHIQMTALATRVVVLNDTPTGSHSLSSGSASRFDVQIVFFSFWVVYCPVRLQI